MKTVRFHRAALVDLAESAAWYDDQRPGLGDDLVSEVDKAIEAVLLNPEAWQHWPDEPRARRFLLERFPFGIAYQLRGDDVFVLAVAHLSREPRYWTGRIGEGT